MVAVAPLLSVTRRPTVKVPFAAKALVVLAVVPGAGLIAAVAVEVPLVFGDRAVGVFRAGAVEGHRLAGVGRVRGDREGSRRGLVGDRQRVGGRGGDAIVVGDAQADRDGSRGGEGFASSWRWCRCWSRSVPLPSRSHSYLAIVPSGSLEAPAVEGDRLAGAGRVRRGGEGSVGGWLATTSVSWSTPSRRPRRR